jgi:phosphopantothenoylcysteine decarboxylase/phosphopantothenate--cysteine ligase
MGLAMAHAARALGAEVTVVLGPVADPGPLPFEVVRVTTAEEMLGAVMTRVEAADVFVATAAVSDWKAETVAPRKTRKGDGPEMVTLVRTPDVLATASAKVHGNAKRPVLVGFAAETHDLVAYAKEKLARKRLDFIVANDVSAPDTGFGGENNSVTVLDASENMQFITGTKREVAERIWSIVAPRAG